MQIHSRFKGRGFFRVRHREIKPIDIIKKRIFFFRKIGACNMVVLGVVVGIGR